MEQERSQFEQLIGENLGAFYIMIEGALKNWKGSYDVILVDKQEYLLRAKNLRNFSPYCRLLRETEGGEGLCLTCDLNAAREAANHPDEGWVHLCDGGLLDIAAPIIIEGRVVAAILCGQARPGESSLEEEGLIQTSILEEKYGITKNQLLHLRMQLPQISISEMTETAKRLAQMTRFVSQLLNTQQEIQKKNKLLEQVSDSQAKVIERLRHIEDSLSPLLPLQRNLDELWALVDSCLFKVSSLLKASNAALLFYDPNSTSENKTTLQSIAKMPNNLYRGIHLNHDDYFSNWDKYQGFHTAAFIVDKPGTLCHYLNESLSPENRTVQSLMTINVGLASVNVRGLLVFFFEEDEHFLSSNFDEQTEFTLIAGSISQAYNNTIAFMQQVHETMQRQEWIKRIEHQLISPLNGVMGHAGRLKERFDDMRSSGCLVDLREDDIIAWQNNIYSLIDTAEWTVTLTRNLTWMADLERSRQTIKQAGLETVGNVPAYLIECARYFQGVAHDYHLRVHVDKGVACLNDRLQIYADYFRMALQNLLDNAVKYSNRGTIVVVEGEATNGHGRIKVTNTGLRLFPEECQKIFDYGYRTKTAHKRRRPGTGIGLSIAQEIIKMHGGLITAKPSEYTEDGWQTTITITLPILQNKGH